MTYNGANGPPHDRKTITKNALVSAVEYTLIGYTLPDSMKYSNILWNT